MGRALNPFPQDLAGRALVMVVDDDAAVRSSLLFSLDIEGYAVRVYPGAKELLEAPDLHACACLIIDQRLHGMNGLELLAELRRQGIGAPAILITTHPDAKLRRLAHEADVAIVEKPLMENALMDRLRTAVVHGSAANGRAGSVPS